MMEYCYRDVKIHNEWRRSKRLMWICLEDIY